MNSTISHSHALHVVSPIVVVHEWLGKMEVYIDNHSKNELMEKGKQIYIPYSKARIIITIS